MRKAKDKQTIRKKLTGVGREEEGEKTAIELK